jgi:hypothetical protein
VYIAKDNENSVGAILFPDVAGAGCGVNMNYITGLTGRCRLGLPNLLPNPCGCPCEDGCEEAVQQANAVLNSRADGKTFTLVANGQTLPGTCELAFNKTDFTPVFSLHWGDGPSDQFESHDTEIIYFRVNNVFRNIVYRDVKIFNIRITPNQTLPDGENALQIIPAEIVCFDEVGPCSYVSRDFAFLIQNAIAQNYQISFEYCIGEIAIVALKEGRVVFDIPVVAS